MAAIDKGNVFPFIERQGFDILIRQELSTDAPIYDDLAWADVPFREYSSTVNV
jgi:hypothetical protein